jgi:hypothetical protein
MGPYPGDPDWSSREDAAYDRPGDEPHSARIILPTRTGKTDPSRISRALSQPAGEQTIDGAHRHRGRSPAPVAVPGSAVDTALDKIPFLGKIKDIIYAGVLGQWAVGFWSALYVLIFQARYWGKSFKYSWDHLNTLWHFKAVPWIGPWLFDHYDLGRHIFMRDAPEGILGFAVVAMIIPALGAFDLATKKRDKPPLLDRVMVRLRMPSPYQGQMGRHPDTSTLQYLFLIPAMLIAAIPGLLVSGVVIFGGMALAPKFGYHSAWLTATSPWVSIVIGLIGGKFAGHKPAVKAGADVQKFYLGKRIALCRAADKILTQFREGLIGQDNARDQLTAMPGVSPSRVYPEVYRHLYRRLLAKGDPVRNYSRRSTLALFVFVAAFVVLGGWGVYLRKYGITHGFWLPW